MPLRRDTKASVKVITDAAERYGYKVIEVTDVGSERLQLDITRNPDIFEFAAHFRRNARSGFYQWRIGAHFDDGNILPVFTMESFIQRLSKEASKGAKR